MWKNKLFETTEIFKKTDGLICPYMKKIPQQADCYDAAKMKHYEMKEM